MFRKSFFIIVLVKLFCSMTFGFETNKADFNNARNKFKFASDEIDPFALDRKKYLCQNIYISFGKSPLFEVTFINRGDEVILKSESGEEMLFTHIGHQWVGRTVNYLRYDGKNIIMEFNLNQNLAKLVFQSLCENSEAKCFMGPSVINSQLFVSSYMNCSEKR